MTLRVTNTGDRPVQVGSHFHFFEINRGLRFERELAGACTSTSPAGTGVRFEPGETKEVTLTAYAGARHLVGFNGLVNGGLDDPADQGRCDRPAGRLAASRTASRRLAPASRPAKKEKQ